MTKLSKNLDDGSIYHTIGSGITGAKRSTRVGLGGQQFTPPSSHRTYVLLPDLHVPWHDAVILNKVLKYVNDIRPDGLVLTGDFVDLFTLARWNEDSLSALRDITLSQEYAKANEVLDSINLVMPWGEKHYLYGNHEDRFFKWIASKDNAKFGQEVTSPTEGLRLRERGYTVYEDWVNDSLKLGAHLEVIHGLYTPENACAKHMKEFDGSVIFGHTHRFGVMVSGRHGAYNIGFLGDRHSAGFLWAKRPQRMKWINGFATVYIDGNGNYWVEPIQIWDKKFVAHGRTY